MNFQTEPYMRELTKEDRERIYNLTTKAKINESGFWAGDSEIRLHEHIGMFNPLLPAFGYGLMNFELNPVEEYQDGLRQINNF